MCCVGCRRRCCSAVGRRQFVYDVGVGGLKVVLGEGSFDAHGNDSTLGMLQLRGHFRFALALLNGRLSVYTLKWQAGGYQIPADADDVVQFRVAVWVLL